MDPDHTNVRHLTLNSRSSSADECSVRFVPAWLCLIAVSTRCFDGTAACCIRTQGRESKGEREAGLHQSYKNEEEASVVLRLMLLMGTDPTVRSIAIITPYKTQVSSFGTE